jgi:outer membrane protein assembly factor BamB
MRKPLIAVVGFGAAIVVALAGSSKPDALNQWGQWRGPLATGAAPRADPPVEWSEEKNVRWKTEIPGLGHSSPIVWGDRVYVTTAIPHGAIERAAAEHDDGAHHNVPANRRQRFDLLAIDRGSGEIVWQKTLADAQPHEGTHQTGSWASASPVTDGKRLFVSFGSRGLFALNMKGKQLWQRDLGDMRTYHGHGEGSSPALWGETLVVNWDHQGDSFVVALNTADGKERWRQPRDEITSWSSPLIVEHDGKAQVVIAATGRVRGYDIADGRVIWECAGLSRNVVATPVAGDGLVFVANSYDSQAMLAIRLSAARGEIAGTEAVVWKLDRFTPYVPSPVLAADALCFLRHLQGVLTCVDPESGEPVHGPRRLSGLGQIFASPVLAAGRLYIADRNGTVQVLRAGGDYAVLATNHLDDSFSASPAVAGPNLYLRGERHLYALGR